MNFREYAFGFQTEINLRLENIRLLAEYLGNPQDNLKCIHVAGTNGKGSVCAFLQAIFTSAGLKTGKYISPNLTNVCERISIDGENISSKDMDSVMDKLEKAADKMLAKPSQFEIWTAAAFLYFQRKKCDIAVIETGLGGRFDATNIIKKPLASVITKISLDHMQFLGNTISEIAFEKGGIIKDGCPVVTTKEGEAAKVLTELSEKHSSPIYFSDPVASLGTEGYMEIFDCGKLKNIKSSLCGIHQTENAALAIKTAQILGIDEKSIRYGIGHAKHPGRMEIIESDPPVIYDGAHNEDGAEALACAIERFFPMSKLSFIYGAMVDKDISGIIGRFKAHGLDKISTVYTVQVKDNLRSKGAEALADDFRNAGFYAIPCVNFAEAYEIAKANKYVTIICGSLYLYKDMEEYRNERDN